MSMLTPRQRAFLKALAHGKKPIILVGHKGITESLVAETSSALLAHELLKVRFHQSEGLEEAASQLASETGADLVAIVGKIGLLYKAHPDHARIRLPRTDAKASPESDADSFDEDVDELDEDEASW